MAQKESPSQRAQRINKALEKKPLTQRQTTWAIEHIFPTQLLWRTQRGKKVFYCSQCGNQVHNISLKECPHCGKPFKDKPAERKGRSTPERAYFCLMTTAQGLQAMRFFVVTRYARLGHLANYSVNEVSRQLFDDKGTRWCFARSVAPMSWYYDAWCYGSPIAYRGTNPESRGQRSALRNSLYCCATLVEHTTARVRRNGIRRSLDFTSYPVDAVKGILTKPWMEQLLKMGQLDLLSHAIRKEITYNDDIMAAIRICNRNHYIVKDADMWLDYLKMLQDLGADTRNAHYVCPEDLKAAHDIYQERHRRHEERIRLLNMKKELEHMEEQKRNYTRRMGALLALSLMGDNINIRPLQTVDEFAEEGAAMHHCVYQNKYWDEQRHPNTLILSAKDSEGHRLATIEYNTARHNIVQCRAVCNGVPERDAEIRALITDHRKDIEALLMQEVKVKATKKKQQNAAVHVA